MALTLDGVLQSIDANVPHDFDEYDEEEKSEFFNQQYFALCDAGPDDRNFPVPRVFTRKALVFLLLDVYFANLVNRAEFEFHMQIDTYNLHRGNNPEIDEENITENLNEILTLASRIVDPDVEMRSVVVA